MILIIWLLRCSLVSLGLRVLRRKLLKGAVLQVAVVNALAACFHHLLWVVGSKEIWWVDTGKGAEEARGTGCRWEQEASVWQQALQREVLYFLFFPLSKLVSLIPCPPTTIIMTFFQTLLCHPTYQSCLMFVLLLFLVWSLVLVELNSGNWDSHRLFPHSTSYPTGTLPGEIGSHPVSYSLCKTDVETVFLASLSSLSQAKAHTSLERKEDLETLELLVWTASKEEDGHGLSSSSTMPGGVYGRAYDQRGYTVPFHEAIQKSNTKRQCNVLALNTGQPVRAGQTLSPAADRSWGRGLVGREEIVDGLQRRREAYERFWWKDL